MEKIFSIFLIHRTKCGIFNFLKTSHRLNYYQQTVTEIKVKKKLFQNIFRLSVDDRQLTPQISFKNFTPR